MSLKRIRKKDIKERYNVITIMSDQVVFEVPEVIPVGVYIGQCKWFNDKLGYGFITIQSGDDKGKDIFVHHSGISPLNSKYKTLKKGEYINFDIVDGVNGPQGVNVTGILGGLLICDVLPSRPHPHLQQPHSHLQQPHSHLQQPHSHLQQPPFLLKKRKTCDL
jgi:CspA family cold shock protein